MRPKWIDIHSHFDMLETSPEEVIALGHQAGVERFITIGTEPSDHDFVLALARKHFPVIACTLGVHPHQGVQWHDSIGDRFRQEAPRPEVVALGEMGLDYYYNQSPAKEQQQAFVAQLDLAQELQLPVQIHTRDAEADTVAILTPYRGKVRGVIHCFTGSEWLARQCLDLGFDISISGVVTFKNAESLRDIVRWLPLDRIHVETDAPFLAPVPQRGKKNTPAFVVHTAEKVAELKNISLEQLAQQVGANARQLFSKLN